MIFPVQWIFTTADSEKHDAFGVKYGKAGNATALDLATKLANDVKGVKDVNNRMVIE